MADGFDMESIILYSSGYIVASAVKGNQRFRQFHSQLDDEKPWSAMIIALVIKSGNVRKVNLSKNDKYSTRWQA